MNKFRSNIINIYKDEGNIWLESLPELVKKIAYKWELTQLKPVKNLSFNYVLSGYQHKNPIILKISPAPNGLLNEINALKAFYGYGTVKVLAEDTGAMLLELAIPGYSLNTYR
jgi:streptomycin 6-kinase